MVPEEPALGHSSQDRPPPGWPLASTPYRPRVTSPGNTGRLPEASRLSLRGRWLKKKYKHMSPAGAQPPVWIGGRRALPAVGPAAMRPKGGSLPGSQLAAGKHPPSRLARPTGGAPTARARIGPRRG